MSSTDSSSPARLGRPHLIGVLAGLFLAAGLVCSALLFTRAWMRISESQVVNVTGSARKNVRSDLAIWRGSFSTDAATLLEAQQLRKKQLVSVESFLRTKGFAEFHLDPVEIREITARVESEEGTVQRRIGYRLTQTIEVRTPEVERIAPLSSDSTELLEQGVAFVSGGIEYIYTKAGEAKIEMMAEATKDASIRAEQIAKMGNRKIRQLRNARMGVVQINPLYSTATSWEGNSDRSALEKTITATITATFDLD